MRRLRVVQVFLAFALIAPGRQVARSQLPPRTPVVVASKPFGESYILAEMFAQTLEAHGMRVSRRPGLGATEIAFGALRSNAIDVYPEYTGTGLLAILHEQPLGDASTVFAHVSQEFAARYRVRWLPPLGFENTYAIAVRRRTADSLHLGTLSDLARASERLRAGLTPDFVGRADGLPGLERAYGLRFRDVRALLPAVKYQALAAGQVDVIDGYSTDGLIARYDLVVLTDDRHFFPPYQAAALVSPRLAAENPAAIAALSELSGRIDEARMRALNKRVEVDGAAVAAVAHDALAALSLGGTVGRASATGPVSETTHGTGALSYMRAHLGEIGHLLTRHIVLVAVSLLFAVILAVPLGLALERISGQAESVIRAVGVLQTLPGIALLAFMIPLLGIGVVPALVALVLYSLYPIVRNTFTGVRDADPAAVGAARALGMTDAQILREVRLPLAMPVIMAGIRTAAVIDVGTATLAAFIGAGGLGEPIVAGLALSDTRMILSGAIPAALLAIAVDGGLAIVERWTQPGYR
ncbi:MAG TPA: glycine betaine ABC transporter substrate-binding protein [Gemmatimonadaceae bacterium]|jgi:osmoprotectant transport system permease protein|nr:glycine betaine ABC transporter substrate-binding protein [Gemmatimonadaceae bacterium]